MSSIQMLLVAQWEPSPSFVPSLIETSSWVPWSKIYQTSLPLSTKHRRIIFLLLIRFTYNLSDLLLTVIPEHSISYSQLTDSISQFSLQNNLTITSWNIFPKNTRDFWECKWQTIPLFSIQHPPYFLHHRHTQLISFNPVS